MKNKPANKTTSSARRKLTSGFVSKIEPPSSGQQFYWDSDLTGFGVRVGRRAKTYIAEHGIKGRPGLRRRVDVGRHGLVTADQARQQAMELLAQMAKGIDPVEVQREQFAREEVQRQEQLQKAAGRVTLKNLFDQFKGEVKLKPRTLADYENYINSAFAKWLDRGIDSITPADVRARHQELGDKGHTYYANGAFRVLSSVLGFAVEEGLLGSNPVQVLRGRGRRGRERKRGKWFEEKRRESVIAAAQLPAWFKALDAVRAMTTPTWTGMGCDYLELLLFTGLRRNEGASLKWENVDFSAKTLTIAETKNGDTHTLPLTEHLESILDRLKGKAGDSEWVFPSPAEKHKGRGFLSEPRAVVTLVEEASGVTFMVHDLRRTFATTAEALDISYLSVKRLLNHRISGDVTAGYVVPNLERLREPMDRITNCLLAHKAAGQGMRIAQ